ncbi:hypothetical protein FG87_32975 [Nocardia vulneris]|uniref:OmpR/PhoB-type domain-containing protein n=1 Tax=Nocardia vulneris TaxID=1141657 RepID=A0ABR4Z785_9NOCA|nr:hypothetical protein FG87_32975 [Nocardia vulneris]
MQLFGPVRVMWQPSRPEQGCVVAEVEITGRLQRRSREVLALLATHSHGLTRTQLVDALWGERGPRRPSNAVCTTLARLRTAVAEATDGAVTRIVDTASGRLRLDQGVTRADYTEFLAAVARRRTAAAVERREVCERIVELAASGVLAADLDAGWLVPMREATRRDAIAALAALTQTLLGTDPSGAALWLETGLVIDPYNELVYRDLLRLHARLGEHHAIDDTLALLTRHLADIGEKPSRETQALARQLKEQCGASR